MTSVRQLFSVFGVLALLASCENTDMNSGTDSATNATSKNALVVNKISASDTSSLCVTYGMPNTNNFEKEYIETELISRGQKECSGVPLGKISLSQYNKRLYPRTENAQSDYSSSGVDYDCTDFSNGAKAQKFFLANGGPNIDPFDLDRDGDGLACEWGKSLASYMTPKPKPKPKPISKPAVSSSRCYTGPRGGTYTLTASGNKNYDGC